MNDTATKLIQFARSQKITKEQFIEAIDSLYASQMDIALESCGEEILEHKVTFDSSVLLITIRREKLNKQDN